MFQTGYIGSISKLGGVTAADLPAGMAAVVKDTISGNVYLAYNDAGAIATANLTAGTIASQALIVTPSANISMSCNQGANPSPNTFTYTLSSSSGNVNYSIAGAGTPTTNFFRMPRRNFSGNGVGVPWSVAGGGGTITDNNAIGWDGSNEASTLTMISSAGGTNPWQVGYSYTSTLPAGTYTIAINAKSNSGSSEVFRFNESVGFSPTQTATTS
jgi:hypothetical protein